MPHEMNGDFGPRSLAAGERGSGDIGLRGGAFQPPKAILESHVTTVSPWRAGDQIPPATSLQPRYGQRASPVRRA